MIEKTINDVVKEIAESNPPYKEENMKLTRRGKQVRAVFIVIGIWAIWQVSTSLWWTETGYCWGTAIECMLDD